jgi:Sec-independent protein secretion pathway component TatC
LNHSIFAAYTNRGHGYVTTEPGQNNAFVNYHVILSIFIFIYAPNDVALQRIFLLQLCILYSNSCFFNWSQLRGSVRRDTREWRIVIF